MPDNSKRKQLKDYEICYQSSKNLYQRAIKEDASEVLKAHRKRLFDSMMCWQRRIRELKQA